MCEVMERCFPDRYESSLPKLKEMVPSLGTKLSNEPALFDKVWSWGSKVLGLDVCGPGVSPEDVEPTEPAAIR
jgi:malate dehydrogenase (quinone)